MPAPTNCTMRTFEDFVGNLEGLWEVGAWTVAPQVDDFVHEVFVECERGAIVSFAPCASYEKESLRVRIHSGLSFDRETTFAAYPKLSLRDLLLCMDRRNVPLSSACTQLLDLEIYSGPDYPDRLADLRHYWASWTSGLEELDFVDDVTGTEDEMRSEKTFSYCGTRLSCSCSISRWVTLRLEGTDSGIRMEYPGASLREILATVHAARGCDVDAVLGRTFVEAWKSLTSLSLTSLSLPAATPATWDRSRTAEELFAQWRGPPGTYFLKAVGVVVTKLRRRVLLGLDSVERVTEITSSAGPDSDALVASWIRSRPIRFADGCDLNRLLVEYSSNRVFGRYERFDLDLEAEFQCARARGPEELRLWCEARMRPFRDWASGIESFPGVDFRIEVESDERRAVTRIVGGGMELLTSATTRGMAFSPNGNALEIPEFPLVVMLCEYYAEPRWCQWYGLGSDSFRVIVTSLRIQMKRGKTQSAK